MATFRLHTASLHRAIRSTGCGGSCTRRVKEAIHIRLHPEKIEIEIEIEIPEAWMPTIKKHNKRRAAKQRTAERTTDRTDEGRNAPITAVKNQPITAEHSGL